MAPKDFKITIKTQAIFKALDGIMSSRPIPIPASSAGRAIYFAHCNKFKSFLNKIEDTPIQSDLKTLKFEPTGKAWFNKKKLVVTYEYILTEI